MDILKNTILPALVMLVLSFPKHGGFISIIFLIPSVIVLSYSIYKVIFKGSDKQILFIKTSIWALSFIIVFGHHVYLHHKTRTYADIVANKIETYNSINNRYPESIEEIGLTKKQIRDNDIYYNVENSEPHLMYPATWIVFDTYQYDFKTKQWAFTPS